MKTASKVGRVAGLWVGFAIGCSSSNESSPNPTVSQVLDSALPGYCEVQKRCDKAAFDADFPQGVSECVAAYKANSKKDPNAKSVCTNDDVKKCQDELKGETCPPNSQPVPWPNACSRC